MLFFQVLLLLLSISSWADTEVVTRIHDIEFGERKKEDVLFFLESGHVVKPHLLKSYPLVSSRQKWWKFRLDEEHRILEMEEVSGLSDVKSYSEFAEGYEPSVIKGGGTAKNYFHESRISRGDTQCYNRAHVWAFELWKRHQIKSQKIFLFFSRKFIRAHNYGWWFHVAPLLIVKEWLGITEKVIDPRYITAPRGIDWWIGKFISGGPECPVITKYSEYADYPFSHDCYILKAPMYIYQPLDLEMLEVWGVQKNEFMLTDLQWAYKEAFQMDYQGELP